MPELADVEMRPPLRGSDDECAPLGFDVPVDRRGRLGRCWARDLELGFAHRRDAR
jgi:hypothetical protein